MSEEFKRHNNVMWVILTGAMALVVSVLLFFPQNLGVGITSVFSLMLWWGLFGLFLFRFVKKKGLIGFIAGSVLGLILHIFAPVIARLLM